MVAFQNKSDQAVLTIKHAAIFFFKYMTYNKSIGRPVTKKGTFALSVFTSLTITIWKISLSAYPAGRPSNTGKQN